MNTKNVAKHNRYKEPFRAKTYLSKYASYPFSNCMQAVINLNKIIIDIYYSLLTVKQLKV